MFLISKALDRYFLIRLKSKEYRAACFEKALLHQLRYGKLNTILLRNLNTIMSDNVKYHDEFKELLTDKDHQQAFWESDLGYLWYKGNLNNKNIYFSYAINEINKNKHTSVLDVGCGWGEFPDKVALLTHAVNTVGIDISASIIEKAKQLHPESKAIFSHKDLFAVNEKFDLITLFGSTDYIEPKNIYKALEKIILSSNKQILIVNSLRKIPIEEAIALKKSVEIKRYDVGYVHSLKYYLDELKSKHSFTYTLEKAGQDSVLANILL